MKAMDSQNIPCVQQIHTKTEWEEVLGGSQILKPIQAPKVQNPCGPSLLSTSYLLAISYFLGA